MLLYNFLLSLRATNPKVGMIGLLFLKGQEGSINKTKKINLGKIGWRC